MDTNMDNGANPMTKHDEEAVIALAQKHYAQIIIDRRSDDPYREVRMHWRRLAALIAEVRRELPAELFDGYAVLKAIPECKHVSADHVAIVLDAAVKLIRARLEEGK